jgi:hypothetical protein
MSNALNEMLLQPSPLGEVFVSARDVQGPTSYTTGGVTVSANGWAMLTLKALISSHLSQDGLYYAKFILPRGYWLSYGEDALVSCYRNRSWGCAWPRRSFRRSYYQRFHGQWRWDSCSR